MPTCPLERVNLLSDVNAEFNTAAVYIKDVHPFRTIYWIHYYKMGCVPSKATRPRHPPSHQQAQRERLQYVEPAPIASERHKKSARRKYENSPQYHRDMRAAYAKANYM